MKHLLLRTLLKYCTNKKRFNYLLFLKISLAFSGFIALKLIKNLPNLYRSLIVFDLRYFCILGNKLIGIVFKIAKCRDV